MFEEEVLEAATNISCKQRSKYYILTHKKHTREMYFRVGDKRALEFVIPKFQGVKKMIIHLLLRFGILQPFLKKIMIPDEIGSLILVGGQIKGFNFDKHIVYSFPHSQWDNRKFVEDKEVQIGLGMSGFAPKIITLVRQIPYSIEEMCEPYMGKIDPVIYRLNEFYKQYPGLIHGEFARQQVVHKYGQIMFVDWDLRKGDLLDDIKYMYRLQKNYENDPEYKRLISLINTN